MWDVGCAGLVNVQSQTKAISEGREDVFANLFRYARPSIAYEQMNALKAIAADFGY